MSKSKKQEFRERGLSIPDMSEDLAEKTDEIRDFMIEESNHRKTGKAETGRLAIILGHKHLKGLEEEKQEKREELAKYLQKVDKVMEELS